MRDPCSRINEALCADSKALSAVVTTQIGNLFAQRSERTPVFRLPLFNKRLLWIGIGAELLLVLLIDYAPFFQKFMGTAAFPLQNWWFLFAWTPALLLVDEFRKLLTRKFPGSRSSAPGNAGPI
jgi:P-type Ca2+ transporter type 2C